MRRSRRRRLKIPNLERAAIIAMSDFDTEQKPSRRLWIFAALGALVLHVGGGALAVAHLQNDDPDDSLGRRRSRSGWK